MAAEGGAEGGADPASIPALLAATAAAHAQRTAVADGEVHRTWAELDRRSEAVAAALVGVGVGSGDRVAIWAPNGHRWIEAVHGVWMAGAVLVPINTRFKGPEAAELLRRSGARALIATRTFLDTDYVGMLEATGAELPALGTTVVAEGDAWEAFVAAGTAEDRDEVARRRAALTGDDPSDLLFTSGTTGAPKGVVMTHGRTLRVAADWVAMTGLSSEDRYLMVNPYFHMFGLKAGILASTVAGAAMHPEPVFDAGRVLERVAAERITVLPGAPTVYQSLLDHPDRDRHDLSTLRVAVTGAADIPVRLIERVREELPFSLVVTGYGLSEAGTASATTPDDDPETVATTVGRARPGFEIRITDPESGADVPAGEPGEVVLRGPSVMREYLDDPEATAAALSPEGWLRTGDLGTLDERGNLRIVGRIKDMFIVGGFNAYPAEIEGVLLRHPDVRQAAVIGIPDERLGEVGMAFVVTGSDDPGVGDRILSWARDQMANYKVPRAIELLDELPINATGKVVKDDLRARATTTPRVLARNDEALDS
jgi:acyl-CoA synthetase (AMP-forming)/AMP-acid ligase II